ncbi:MAG: hypothetical protein ACD_45C00662G0006 [uncultured bacterium]|nr:MAG: hypothetical protein ACD_45C00662G0006 [uncultured bacterium]
MKGNHLVSTLRILGCLLALSLSACGIHPRGETNLAPPLHHLYIQTTDPYGYLAKSLEQYFSLSKVKIVSSSNEATAILNILHDTKSQVLLGVSSTQQTRQYNLITTIEFSVTDPKGRILLPPYTLSDARTITVQSDQILGASNETTLFYKLMQRTLAYAIINHLASQDATRAITHAYHTP